ncbi:Polyphosphoinositide phosphatase [Candida viswanathii]|uniref:Polyphosphoinositide phosphatase n=1 Tax=Candida viswanathii TaxID=5486 RepID=A0A367XYN6_9ASCO|nr:Polyphosphoinositide phosphatase [Candida viswanathii]
MSETNARSGYSSTDQSARQSLSDLIQHALGIDKPQANGDTDNQTKEFSLIPTPPPPPPPPPPQQARTKEEHPNQELQQIQEASQQDEEAADEQEEGEDSQQNEGAPAFSNKRIILQRFTIYNSTSTMYIVGSNSKESLFRIMEISKDEANPNEVSIVEDRNYFYTRKDMIALLNGLDESIEEAFIRLHRVAILGGHFIYHIDETKLIPLGSNYKRPEKGSDEERLFYDVTNTLQTNFIRNKKKAADYQFGTGSNPVNDLYNSFDHNERFVWNNLLLLPILQNPEVAAYEWFQPIVHGFIDQANISIYGRKFYITIIARRSHHFAGARFLKRGVNDKGNVANEIETEQIVSDMLITSFHDPKYGFYNSPRYTSFVQHRGSIPLYWTQDMNKLPKPPIQINLNDPYYQSSALHFNNLFHRYGLPVIILNLIKQKEKTPRELKLNQYFMDCIRYLDQFLPEDKKLQYFSFDMSKHSKKNLDVIGPLLKIASNTVSQIGFFHNGTNLASTKLQKGVIRTNCIDCLDRTNAAQFIIYYDSDLVNVVTEIFHDHGDTIAIQYGGSNLVNTMDSYRRINQWSSHTRDMLNSIKRMYSNSFMDQNRQDAINLFLGNYVYSPDTPKLWELHNDFALHNDTAVGELHSAKKSYTHWYNENYLHDSRYLFDEEEYKKDVRLDAYPDCNDKWFNECYIPRKYQSFTELFQFNMNSNSRYFPSIDENGNKEFDYSPNDNITKSTTATPTKRYEASKNADDSKSTIVEQQQPPENHVAVSDHDLQIYNSQWDYKKILNHQTVNQQDYSFNPRVKTNIEDKQIYWYYTNELLHSLRDSFHGNYLDVIGPQDLKTYLSFNTGTGAGEYLDGRLDLNTDNNYLFSSSLVS